MATNWTDAETFLLIEQWAEQGIQEQLEGSKRNKHVYARLSSELAKDGVEKTGEQCRSKVKKLRQEYKKIKDNHNQTGTGRTKWKFYERLNEILGNRPATCPPVILDTLTDDSAVPSDEMSDEDEDGAQSEKSDDVDGPELTSSRSATPVSRSATPVSRAATTVNTAATTVNTAATTVSTAATTVSSAGIKGKKRKRSKGELIDDLVSKWQDASWIRREKDEVWRTAKERRKAISAADDADVDCICSPMQSPTWPPCPILAHIPTIRSSTTVLPWAWRNRWFLISEQCGTDWQTVMYLCMIYTITTHCIYCCKVSSDSWKRELSVVSLRLEMKALLACCFIIFMAIWLWKVLKLFKQLQLSIPFMKEATEKPLLHTVQ